MGGEHFPVLPDMFFNCKNIVYWSLVSKAFGTSSCNIRFFNPKQPSTAKIRNIFNYGLQTLIIQKGLSAIDYVERCFTPDKRHSLLTYSAYPCGRGNYCFKLKMIFYNWLLVLLVEYWIVSIDYHHKKSDMDYVCLIHCIFLRKTHSYFFWPFL